MWINIKGYEGLYVINEHGMVKSLFRKTDKLTVKERILKFDKNNMGYNRVTLSKEGKAKRFFVHRLVYESFISEIPKGLVINHLDENKLNNHFLNLEACSTLKNNHHSRESLGYKLYAEDIACIRSNNMSVKEITLKYNISKRHALRIIKNERWIV